MWASHNVPYVLLYVWKSLSFPSTRDVELYPLDLALLALKKLIFGSSEQRIAIFDNRKTHEKAKVCWMVGYMCVRRLFEALEKG